jgi:hypothetical protein
MGPGYLPKGHRDYKRSRYCIYMQVLSQNGQTWKHSAMTFSQAACQIRVQLRQSVAEPNLHHEVEKLTTTLEWGRQNQEFRPDRIGSRYMLQYCCTVKLSRPCSSRFTTILQSPHTEVQCSLWTAKAVHLRLTKFICHLSVICLVFVCLLPLSS